MPKRVPRETRRRDVDRLACEIVDIASPYSGTDRVLRRVDSLARLRGSGIIGDREMRAAERYRTAWQMVLGSGITCTLAGQPGTISPVSRTPPLRILEAAELLAEARKQLGQSDDSVVQLIVIGGLSINEAAARLFAGERAREHVGHRLRWALRALADLWFGSGSPRRRNHVHREDDARPQSTVVNELVPGRVAHASRKGVSYA